MFDDMKRWFFAACAAAFAVFGVFRDVAQLPSILGDGEVDEVCRVEVGELAGAFFAAVLDKHRI